MNNMKKTMNKNTGIVLGFVLAVAISFWGGMTYATRVSGAGTRGNGVSGAMGGGGMRGMRNGGGFATGDVLSKDEKSMTISLRDGGSKIILVSPSTSVVKAVPGLFSDVSVGAQVVIGGTANQDGSISAASVQIRPARPPVLRDATGVPVSGTVK